MTTITIIGNEDNTVGLVKTAEPKKLIKGYFNKYLLIEFCKVLEVIDSNDVELSYVERDGASMLLARSGESHRDVFVAVTGKTEFES